MADEQELPVGTYSIKAKTSNDAGDQLEAAVVVALGDTIADAVGLHGQEAVDKAYLKGATLKVQQDIRGILNDGGTQEGVTEFFEREYKMDFTRKERSTDPKARLRRILASMSAEEQEEFFGEYDDD